MEKIIENHNQLNAQNKWQYGTQLNLYIYSATPTLKA